VGKIPEPEALEILALPPAGEEDDGEDPAVEVMATEPQNE
jgi:hypothetical protein